MDSSAYALDSSDDRRRDACLAQGAAHVEAVHLRQHDVQQDEVPPSLFAELQALQAVGGVLRLVALATQVLLECQHEIRLVFDDENARHQLCASCGASSWPVDTAGRTSRNVLPTPSSDSSVTVPPCACTI